MSGILGLLIGATLVLLVLPYCLLRGLLHASVQAYPDPTCPEAARSLRATGLFWVTTTVLVGLAVANHYYQASLHPTGWIGLDAAIARILMWLPLGPVAAVLLAVSIPVSVNNVVAQGWED